MGVEGSVHVPVPRTGRGVQRVLFAGVWTIRDNFGHRTFGDDAQLIGAYWECSEDGQSWQRDFAQTLNSQPLIVARPRSTTCSRAQSAPTPEVGTRASLSYPALSRAECSLLPRRLHLLWLASGWWTAPLNAAIQLHRTCAACVGRWPENQRRPLPRLPHTSWPGSAWPTRSPETSGRGPWSLRSLPALPWC